VRSEAILWLILCIRNKKTHSIVHSQANHVHPQQKDACICALNRHVITIKLIQAVVKFFG